MKRTVMPRMQRAKLHRDCVVGRCSTNGAPLGSTPLGLMRANLGATIRYSRLGTVTLIGASLALLACGASTPLSPSTPRTVSPRDAAVADTGIGSLDRDPGPGQGRPCTLLACQDATTFRVLSAAGVPTSGGIVSVFGRDGTLVARCGTSGVPELHCRTQSPGVYQLDVVDSVLTFELNNGRTPLRFSGAPMYTRRQPNGPGCGPVCYDNIDSPMDIQLP